MAFDAILIVFANAYLAARSRAAGVSAEVVTPPLTYDELPKLQEVVRALRHAGARCDAQTGIHVHVDASRHDAKSLTRLAKLIHSKEELLFKALQVDSARLARYTRPVDEVVLGGLVTALASTLVILPVFYAVFVPDAGGGGQGDDCVASEEAVEESAVRGR